MDQLRREHALNTVLNHVPSVEFLYELQRRCQDQTEDIQKVREEWHRIRIVFGEADLCSQDTQADIESFVLDHPEPIDGISLYTSPAFLALGRFKKAVQDGDMQRLYELFKTCSKQDIVYIYFHLIPCKNQLDTMKFILIGSCFAPSTYYTKWFRPLTADAYQALYESVRKIVHDHEKELAAVDAVIRPLVGSRGPVLDLSVVQHKLQRDVAAFEEELRAVVGSFSPDTPLDERRATFKKFTDETNPAFYNYVKHEYVPWCQKAEERYAFLLLGSIYEQFALEKILVARLQAIEEWSKGIQYPDVNDVLSKKFQAEQAYRIFAYYRFQRNRMFCQNMTDKELRAAVLMVEAALPYDVRKLAWQTDCATRFTIDPAHMARGDEPLEIPDPPRGVNLEQLSEMVASLLKSEAGRVITFPAGRPTALQVILKLIQKVQTQGTDVGTPPEKSQALQLFYEEITKALLHIINTIDRPDVVVQTKAAVILDLLEGVGHCGVGMKFAIINAYKKYVLKIPPTKTSCVDRPAAELRLAIATDVPYGVTSAQSVHHAQMFMRRFGEVFGLPGWNSLRVEGSQVFAHDAGFDDRQAFALFLRNYSPAQVYEWIAGLGTEEVRNLVLDCCSTPPAGWRPMSVAERQAEITRKAAIARSKVQLAVTDQEILQELNALEIQCPPQTNRTPGYWAKCESCIRITSDSLQKGCEAARKKVTDACTRMSVEVEELLKSNPDITTFANALRSNPQIRALKVPEPAHDETIAVYRKRITDLIAAYGASEIANINRFPDVLQAEFSRLRGMDVDDTALYNALSAVISKYKVPLVVPKLEARAITPEYRAAAMKAIDAYAKTELANIVDLNAEMEATFTRADAIIKGFEVSQKRPYERYVDAFRAMQAAGIACPIPTDPQVPRDGAADAYHKLLADAKAAYTKNIMRDAYQDEVVCSTGISGTAPSNQLKPEGICRTLAEIGVFRRMV